jgi:hypothetical protein
MRLPGPSSRALNKAKNDSKKQGLFEFPMKTAMGVAWRCLILKRPVAIFGHDGEQLIQHLTP